MANLIVRNIDEAIVKALKKRATQHGVSAEAEHRKILEQALLQPQRKSFAEVLLQIPIAFNFWKKQMTCGRRSRQHDY